jgi:hypothetical protein
MRHWSKSSGSTNLGGSSSPIPCSEARSWAVHGHGFARRQLNVRCWSGRRVPPHLQCIGVPDGSRHLCGPAKEQGKSWKPLPSVCQKRLLNSGGQPLSLTREGSPPHGSRLLRVSQGSKRCVQHCSTLHSLHSAWRGSQTGGVPPSYPVTAIMKAGLQ